MALGVLTIHLAFYSCKSLKEKRRLLKPLLQRIHKEFNVSVAEMGLQNKWTESIISVSYICNNRIHAQSELNSVLTFIQNYYRNIDILENHIELI